MSPREALESAAATLRAAGIHARFLTGCDESANLYIFGTSADGKRCFVTVTADPDGVGVAAMLAEQGGQTLAFNVRRVPPLSDEAKAARAPRPPEELVGALHDRTHPTSGRLLDAKPIVKVATVRVPTDAAVVIREDFRPDVEAATAMVSKTRALLAKMKGREPKYTICCTGTGNGPFPRTGERGAPLGGDSLTTDRALAFEWDTYDEAADALGHWPARIWPDADVTPEPDDP